MRINVGCGQDPTDGWRNFDNSPSLRLAMVPLLPALLRRLKLLDDQQYAFMEFARSHSIEFGDVTKSLPIPHGSVDAIYSCHMLEHLDGQDAAAFLTYATKLLRPGGILRLAVPDLRKHADWYLESGDADDFISGILVCQPRPRTMLDRVRAAFIRPTHHLWMYDGPSLCRLLLAHGFEKPEIMPPGQTRIRDAGKLNLQEALRESVYVEAENPGYPGG